MPVMPALQRTELLRGQWLLEADDIRRKAEDLLLKPKTRESFESWLDAAIQKEANATLARVSGIPFDGISIQVDLGVAADEALAASPGIQGKISRRVLLEVLALLAIEAGYEVFPALIGEMATLEILLTFAGIEMTEATEIGEPMTNDAIAGEPPLGTS